MKPLRRSHGARIAAAAAAAAVVAAAPAARAQTQADEATLEWGSVLAADCAQCHQIAPGIRTGNFSGIPGILGLSRDEFADKMREQAAGDDVVMSAIAQSLGDDEIDALAAYLETVEIED